MYHYLYLKSLVCHFFSLFGSSFRLLYGINDVCKCFDGFDRFLSSGWIGDVPYEPTRHIQSLKCLEKQKIWFQDLTFETP